jgi:polyvinyl alcohol dehydrogenase (cytochrome)
MLVAHRGRPLAALLTALTVAGLVAVPAVSAAQTAALSGEAVYARHCASCHEQVSGRIPSREALTRMSPSRILRTLDFGLMMSIAYPMRRDEREAVATFLGRGAEDAAPPPSAFCTQGLSIASGSPQQSWPGWSPSHANTRFQPAEHAGLSANDVRSLELKWAFGFAGDVIAVAAPTLVNGTLFVGSAGGVVQALDARTGCLHWRYQADGPVRAAMTAVAAAGRTSLVFSDQNGGVYAIDARSGQLHWKKRVEAHEATRLTGSVTVHDGLAFVPAASWEETRSIDPSYPCCTFRGSVTALRVSDGSLVWKTYFADVPQKTGMTSVGTPTFGPSGAAVWSAPTVDAARRLVYVTTGDNYSHPATPTSDAVVALDLESGRVVWLRQTTPGDVYNSSCGTAGANCPPERGPDHDYGASAMLVRTPDGRELIVAGQKSGVVYALDPANQGSVLWQARVGTGGINGGVQWGMASDGRLVYAAVSDVVRPSTVSGPSPIGNATFDDVAGGGLTALNAADGARVWFAPSVPCRPARPGCSPAQSAAVTAIPGAVFSGSLDGHLRAFSTADGSLLWDFDTARTYTTVNGVPANGGSLDGAGPVIAGGMVFVNSGYPRFGGAPGNVLLAFGLR